MRILLFVTAISLLAATTACQRAPAPVQPEIDTTFELTDESGAAVTSNAYKDRLRLVFFGFTTCPDICPITLQNIATALRSLDESAGQVTVLFISIDPKRDTPDKLTVYTDAFHPSVVGLTGTYDQLLAVTRGFRTTFGFFSTSDDGQERPLTREEYESLPQAASYTPYHSSQVYLIGREDDLLDIIGYGSKPALIEGKLRSYLN